MKKIKIIAAMTENLALTPEMIEKENLDDIDLDDIVTDSILFDIY